MEIPPLLIKCPMTTNGKQHPLSFDREQWQHMEKSHPLHGETAVATYVSPFTSY